jgi:ribokinase
MRAYVIGNVTIDETLAVNEMPQAGASIFGSQRSRDLGGKGANQAIVLGRCGLPTTLVAAIGEGPRADMIRQHLAIEPIASRLVPIGGASSDFSVIFTTPDGENAIVTTTDSAGSLGAADSIAPLTDAGPGDIAVLQGNLTDATTRGVFEATRERGMTTAFNPSPVRHFFASLWHLVDIAFLNQGEALALTGASRQDAARALLAAGVRDVVLTLGGEGAMLANADSVITISAEPCPVVDTTGAGDTFMAVALASALLRGVRLDRRAIAHATRAAAITVGRRGTRSAFPSVEELAGILASS